MIGHEQLAAMVAEVLMPGAPDMVRGTAEEVARALLKDHAVVSLPTSSYEDDQGISWDSVYDDSPLATAAGAVVWVHDDMLEVDEAEEWGAALLAAARAARTVRR